MGWIVGGSCIKIAHILQSHRDKLIMLINYRDTETKNRLLRAVALFLTILCAVTLHDVGEPRSLSASILRGLVLSFILNGSLWLCTFEAIRIKLKFFASILNLISGFGVFFISPYGWTLAALFLIFHIWFAYDLVTVEGTQCSR